MTSRGQGRNLGRGLEKCKQHGIMRELPQVFGSRLLTFGPHSVHPQIRCFQATDCSRFSCRVSKVAVFQSSCSDLGSTLPCCQQAGLLWPGARVNWLLSSCFFGRNNFPMVAQLTLRSFPVVGLSCVGRRGWQYRLSPPTRYG